MYVTTQSLQPGTVFEVGKGYQLIRVSSPTIGLQAIFSFDAFGIEKLSGSDNYFSTTKDTSGRINVYKVGEHSFAVQNKTSDAKGINIMSI